MSVRQDLIKQKVWIVEEQVLSSYTLLVGTLK